MRLDSTACTQIAVYRLEGWFLALHCDGEGTRRWLRKSEWNILLDVTLGDVEFGTVLWLAIGHQKGTSGCFPVSLYIEEEPGGSTRLYVLWYAHLEPFFSAVSMSEIDLATTYTPELEYNIVNHGLRSAMLHELGLEEASE